MFEQETMTQVAEMVAHLHLEEQAQAVALNHSRLALRRLRTLDLAVVVPGPLTSSLLILVAVVRVVVT